MKQIAAVCAAAALYIFTVFASARVQAQPAVQVDAPETPPAHTESAPLSTGASTTTAATVPATTRPSAPSATGPAGCTVGGRLVSLVHSSVPGFAAVHL